MFVRFSLNIAVVIFFWIFKLYPSRTYVEKMRLREYVCTTAALNSMYIFAVFWNVFSVRFHKRKNAFIRVNFNLFLFLQLTPPIYREYGHRILFFIHVSDYFQCVPWCSLSLSFYLSFSLFLSDGGGGWCCCCLLLLRLVKACLFSLVAHSQQFFFFFPISISVFCPLSLILRRYHINFYILYNILYMRRYTHIT